MKIGWVFEKSVISFVYLFCPSFKSCDSPPCIIVTTSRFYLPKAAGKFNLCQNSSRYSIVYVVFMLYCALSLTLPIEPGVGNYCLVPICHIPKPAFKLIQWLNPIALRKAKIVYNFGLSESNRTNVQ